MSAWPYTLSDIESAMLTAYATALGTTAATLSPVPTVRTWRDQSNHAVYPVYLIHVQPAAADSVCADPHGPLYQVYVQVAAQTHADEQPPSSGTTPVAGDASGAQVRAMLAAARAQLTSSPVTIDDATVLDTTIADPVDTSDGPVNHLGFTVTHWVQLTED